MTPARVSIVTPVLNRVATIEACLRSIAQQTHPDVEHIVVDGGSTDGTLDVLASFEGRPGFRYISGPDDGMYDAINKGFELSGGDVMAYLNSDDVYLPYSIEVAVRALEGADMVYGDLGVLVDRDPPSFYPQFYRDFDMRFYTYWWTLAQPTVFWRRSVWERTGAFDTSYRLLGDCEYWLRAASSGIDPVHLDEILAVQVEHEGTLRVTQEERLRAEFARMRADYAAAAGRRGRAWWEHLRRSWHWRVNQARFLRALGGGSTRWSRFASFVKEQGIHIDRGGALRHLLPQRWRGENTSTIDAVALRRAVLAR